MMRTLSNLKKWLLPCNDWLAGSLLLFVAMGFFIKPVGLWFVFFDIAVVPATLYRLYKGTPCEWKAPWFLLTIAMLVWTAITLFWADGGEGGRILKYAQGAVMTGFFATALTVVLKTNPLFLRRLGSVVITAGSVNATLSCLYFLSPFSHMDRLEGWALTQNSILGSLVVGVYCLFALFRSSRYTKQEWKYFLRAFPGFLFIALAQSRGAYLAVFVGALTLLPAFPAVQIRRFISVSGLLALSGLALTQTVLGVSVLDIYHRLFDRLDSRRFEVWMFSLNRIQESPYLGHSPVAYLGLEGVPFPHNIFLSTLFFYGVVGLVPFVILLAMAFKRVWTALRRSREALFVLALLNHAMVGGLTDLAQLADRPSPLWLVLWLPLILALVRFDGPPRTNKTAML